MSLFPGDVCLQALPCQGVTYHLLCVVGQAEIDKLKGMTAAQEAQRAQQLQVGIVLQKGFMSGRHACRTNLRL